MPYNPKLNVAFTLIPRNASASIAKALGVEQEFTPPDEEAHELLLDSDPWKDAAMRFVCVRPVFDRFLSAVRSFMDGGLASIPDNLQTACREFDVLKVLDILGELDPDVIPLAFAPQSTWLKRSFDHLVAQENIATFFNHFQLPALPGLGKSPGMMVLTPEFRQVVQDHPAYQTIYGDDIAFLDKALVWSNWPVKMTVNGPCPTCK